MLIFLYNIFSTGNVSVAEILITLNSLIGINHPNYSDKNSNFITKSSYISTIFPDTISSIFSEGPHTTLHSEQYCTSSWTNSVFKQVMMKLIIVEVD